MISQIKKFDISFDELEEKLNLVGLREYGVYQDFLIDKIYNILKKREKIKSEDNFELIATLNNADLVGNTLDIIKDNIQEVVDGLNIIASSIKAIKKVIILPEYSDKFTADIKTFLEDNHIELRREFVNVRKHTNDLIIHLITIMEVGEIFNQKYEEGTYISVNGKKCKKYNSELKIQKIFEEENIDLENIKAFEAGFEIYNIENLDKSLRDININNGILKTIGNSECIVQKVQDKLLEYRKTSCGKCVFCREGLVQLYEMQKDIIDEKAKMEYMSIFEEIGSTMIFSNLCSLGQVSSKISLTSLDVLYKEYEDHIKKKNCEAGICYNKTQIYIDPLTCEGCQDCIDVCPEDCIEGKKGFIHMIDEFDCTQCEKCIKECSYDAIIMTTGRLPKLPDRLTKVGRFKKR